MSIISSHSVHIKIQVYIQVGTLNNAWMREWHIYTGTNKLSMRYLEEPRFERWFERWECVWWSNFAFQTEGSDFYFLFFLIKKTHTQKRLCPCELRAYRKDTKKNKNKMEMESIRRWALLAWRCVNFKTWVHNGEGRDIRTYSTQIGETTDTV